MTEAVPQIDPAVLQQAQQLYSQTEAYIAEQDFENALETLEQAVDILETPDGYYWLGALYNNFERQDDALDAFENCVRMSDEYFAAHAELGTLKMDKAQFFPALHHYRRAYELAPEKLVYGVQITGFLERVRSWKFQPEIKTMVTFCLSEDEIDSTMLGRTWFSILKTDPVLKSLKTLMKQKNDKGFDKALRGLKDKNIFDDGFLIQGLQNLTIADYGFEQFLERLRRSLLLGDQALRDAFSVRFLQALAVYCGTTEYIFYATEEENQALDLLANQDSLSSAEICLLACYGYLQEDKYTSVITAHAELALLQKYHVDLPQQLYAMREKIPALTPIDDDVSRDVQGQYEEFPYPRWEHYTPALKDQAENFLREGNPQILVAGCGTGLEAVELATALPEAKILAVDLSLSSLSYAAQKAKEIGIKNIAFQQADILKLGSIDRTFDFIVSSGVLHHMDKPEDDLAVLTGLLKPEGRMRLAFYSSIARRSVIKAQNLIKDKGYGNGADEIRRFRHDAPQLLSGKELGNLCDFRDYYLTSECRDLLFHVQEHCYELPELSQMLESNNLEFLHFYQDSQVMQKYKMRNMDDPEGRNLAHWHEFEKKNPDTFAGMYRFWVAKKP